MIVACRTCFSIIIISNCGFIVFNLPREAIIESRAVIYSEVDVVQEAKLAFLDYAGVMGHTGFPWLC